MDNINLYLDSDQVMPYLEKLNKMNEFDPEHYDSIAYNFCTYVLTRKTELVNNYNINKFMKKKKDSRDNKFIVSKEVMDYLSALTGLSYLKKESEPKTDKIYLVKKKKEVV